ncbi:MAG: peptide/nickel transport system permease protein, partial [Gammaproteobacteria bacterium]
MSEVLAADSLTLDQAAPTSQVRSYWQSVRYRLRYDHLTLFFGAMVVLIVLSAIFAP